jgi:GT2 family glycosyltransferase
LIGNEVIWFPGGWNEFDIEGKHIVIPYANGWFLACTREVWINLGGFDWKTFGRMDYEDVDVSTRAIELGYNIVALNSKKIVHAHQGSTVDTLKIDRMAHTKQNRIKFIAKWADRLTDIALRLEKNRNDRNTDST